LGEVKYHIKEQAIDLVRSPDVLFFMNLFMDGINKFRF